MRTFVVFCGGACLALGLAAAGCASSAMTVDTITPELALQADARATGRETKVAVEEFKAARDKNKKHLLIGEAKTGFFNGPTDILVSESPEQIVTAAIREACTKVGFRVVDAKDAQYVLGGQVENFWVDEYATGVSLEYAKAFVRYDVLVKDGTGRTIWGATKQVYETSGQCWDATAKNIPTLTQALDRTVRAIFEDESFWEALSK